MVLKRNQLESLVDWVREQLRAQLSTGCRGEDYELRSRTFWEQGLDRGEEAGSWANKGLVHPIKLF